MKLPPSDWPAGKSVGHFLNKDSGGRAQHWAGAPGLFKELNKP